MNDVEMRLSSIKKIIETRDVASQFELMELLEKEFNIMATQAVISRDLKRLGVAMKQKEGKRVYTFLHKDTHKEMLKLAIQDIAYNEVMITIHTTAGIADFVGDFIDANELDVLGCLAGENTILVVPKTIKKMKQTYEQLCQVLYFNPKEKTNV